MLLCRCAGRFVSAVSFPVENRKAGNKRPVGIRSRQNRILDFKGNGIFMGKILYFDCYAGISGDLTLGAFVDLGVKPEYLQAQLDLLGISDEFELTAEPKKVREICGTQVGVHITGRHHHDHSHACNHSCGAESPHVHESRSGHVHGRSLADILDLIRCSGLNENTKRLAGRIFRVIGEAEAKVHAVPLQDVHFHEVGAVDSIVDVIGAAVCIDLLKPDAIYCSPVHDGSGFIECAHGTIPVPVPAVVELLKNSGIAIVSDDVPTEMVTPTGMGILKGAGAVCRRIPPMAVEASGTGYGTRDTGKASGLRILFGTDRKDLLDKPEDSDKIKE